MPKGSLRQDQTELIVLAVLREAPMYGYGMSKAVGARSGGEVKLGPGVLYPLLASLEKAKLVTTTWEEVRAAGREDGASGRRRKWYRLTAKGRKRLEKRAEEHRRQVALINGFLAASGAAGGPEGATA